MGLVFAGVVEIESVDMNDFSYEVCSSCMRRPGTNPNCADCAPSTSGGGRPGGWGAWVAGGAAAAPRTFAYRLRAEVRADGVLVRAVLFDGAARRLLGYSAEQMERFILRADELQGADAALVPRTVGDARGFVESAASGTVVLCNLEDKGGTEASLKILSILSDTPFGRMSAAVDSVLSSGRRAAAGAG